MYKMIGVIDSDNGRPLNDTQQPAVTLQLPATTKLNETFSDELRDPTSEKFKEVEESFCDQVNEILKKR